MHWNLTKIGSCRLREMVLRWLPVATNRALEGGAPEAGASPIKAVLRSKGFMWMSHSHTTAFYWSHAGQHFEIRDEGEWCARPPPCPQPDPLYTLAYPQFYVQLAWSLSGPRLKSSCTEFVWHMGRTVYLE